MSVDFGLDLRSSYAELWVGQEGQRNGREARKLLALVEGRYERGIFDKRGRGRHSAYIGQAIRGDLIQRATPELKEANTVLYLGYAFRL